MAKTRTQVVKASAATTATGVSDAIAVAGKDLALLVDVSAASGTTPTLDVSVEWSYDGTNWAVGDTADTFAQLTAAAKKVKSFTSKARYARVRWTIGGTTPSFTLAVSSFQVV